MNSYSRCEMVMAKGKKPAAVADDAPTDELSRTLADIRLRFRKLVIGSYFPHKKVLEFLAYLDSLKPKAKADDAATKPTAKPEPTAAGAPSGPGHVGRDSDSHAG